MSAAENKAAHVTAPPINFDLASALQSAAQTRLSFNEAYHSEGTRLLCHEQPVWARQLLRKKETTDAVMDKLGSGSFMRRKPEDNQAYRAYVARCLDEQSPLAFRLGCGPLKNRNICGDEQQPDCAEYLMFVQLARFVSAVAALYPYGISVQMIPDDLRACAANLCPRRHVCSYIAGMRRMVADLGFAEWLQFEDGQQNLVARYNVPAYHDAAEASLYDWQARDPESFTEKWQRAVENAAHNIILHHPDADTARREAEAAAWRYLVAHQSEVLSGLWSVGEVFPLRYGRHPQFYQLFTMKENQTQLPWQIKLPFPSLPHGGEVPLPSCADSAA